MKMRLPVTLLLIIVFIAWGAFQNVALKKRINLGNQTHTTMTREEFFMPALVFLSLAQKCS